jgi:TRAP-type mannitol/chloroaromatic compound transport system permease small subunit
VVRGALLLVVVQLNEVSAAPGGLPYRWVLKSFLVTAFALLALVALGRLTRVWPRCSAAA